MPSLLILLIVAAVGAARAEPTGGIIVSAGPAGADIALLSSAARLIRLPKLEYTLTIEPECGEDMQPESISISIADTRKTIREFDLGEQPLIETIITIPPQQLAPLAVDGFCRVEGSDAAATSLHVADIVTAQLSLRCVGDTVQTIVYASEALDVKLRCRREEAEPDLPSVEDQPPMPASSTR